MMSLDKAIKKIPELFGAKASSNQTIQGWLWSECPMAWNGRIRGGPVGNRMQLT